MLSTVKPFFLGGYARMIGAKHTKVEVLAPLLSKDSSVRLQVLIGQGRRLYCSIPSWRATPDLSVA